MDNQNSVISIASKHLGKVGGEGYKATYDPELLVAIPRHFNRESYNIKEGDLPFVGGDVWNAYEVSAITKKGRPVSGMMKIYYSSDSPLHVESKSIKLYLNSFNMTPLGETGAECVEIVEKIVAEDLSKALQTDVQVSFHTGSNDTEVIFGLEYDSLNDIIDLDAVEFNTYHSDASQLKTGTRNERILELKIHSDLLRSNCRVTNQPDWGDVYIHLVGKNMPDLPSLARYIVSHRQVSHFHEEICEMMFVHLLEAYDPEKLMVTCLYTRRGGLDINPIRATHADMIPGVFIDVHTRNAKTLRQ
jgi:7-cyano-7-deazaguanine reductase